MLEWEEGDRFSFEDSERFEEESECSWLSEPESLCNNWRGWKRPSNGLASHAALPFSTREPTGGDGCIKSLAELCARTVAAHIPFEVVEQMMPVVPEQIQLWIAYWSFPDNEEDIRLYSCLANGNAEEFVRGETLYKRNCVDDVLQIGFHLSATVVLSAGSKGSCKVAVGFDRGRITSSNCTCASSASYCSHVVAVCLNRIHQPHNLKLRAPVSESLSRLQRDQLQKFAQYLISELPQQILPTAQRLIDEILSSQPSDINTVSGAPDPTAGASANEQTAWWLDENNLHENIHKILVKFCVPSPLVFSDVNYLSATAPPVSTEWQSLLRPLRGREPEGMWNLLSIVREMFKRQDHNAIPLLEVITDECLATEKILVWWVTTRVALHSGSSSHGGKNNVNSNSHCGQYACSSLCDEIVILWRLAALNPALSPKEREVLIKQLKNWHIKILEKVARSKEAAGSNVGSRDRRGGNEADVFPGFKSAIEACFLDWQDYPLPGITYSHAASHYYCPVMCCKHDPNHESHAAPISAPQARMPPQFGGLKRNMDRRIPGIKGTAQWVALEGARSVLKPRSDRSSSVSSEGFCDNDMGRDSDSSIQEQQLSGRELDAFSQNAEQRKRKSSVIPTSSSSSSATNGGGGGGGGGDVPSSFPPPSQRPPNGVPVRSDLASTSGNPSRTAGSAAVVAVDRSNRDLLLEEDDGYGVYVYNADLVRGLQQSSSSEHDNRNSTDSDNNKNNADTSSDVFASIKKLDDSMEILFARAEGLHAHGHVKEASRLAVQLAKELLANPPNLTAAAAVDVPVSKMKRKKMNPASHHLTCLASATLSKCAFLCTVLADDSKNTHLAFQVALFGLEMSRPPASTKPLEVKLANQESDLVNLLKRLSLGAKELAVIREKAELMSCGKHSSRGEALLPLMLATFLFDALVVGTSTRIACGTQNYRRTADERLGFEAAMAAIAMKSNVSEADHPILCEGTRRQRGELALTLLTHYKDDREKLSIVMDKFLDKDVHQMYRTSALPTHFYSATKNTNHGPSGAAHSSDTTGAAADRMSLSGAFSPPCSAGGVNPAPSSGSKDWTKSINDSSGLDCVERGVLQLSLSPQPINGGNQGKNSSSMKFCFDPTEDASRGAESLSAQSASGAPEVMSHGPGESWEDEYKAWEEKLSSSGKQRKKRSHHHHHHQSTLLSKKEAGAGLVASLSADGSWLKRRGPGSDSGSSGNSSDSVVSVSSGDKVLCEANKLVESPPLGGLMFVRPPPHSLPDAPPQVRPHPPPPFGKKYKGKRAYPTVPNQPSEAGAYFMFELAKTVLTKAGVISSTSLFKQPPTNQQSHRGPNRALQMCAFQIGLYALGLSNCVSPNWLSRTYSSHVSWISNQATEIGASALSFLIDTWEGHLTPPEAASIADKASRGRDANTIRQAARLALSCLPHAHALNINQIQTAIIQCKELSNNMLEGACLAVEGAAKGGGVYPEVLFSVARYWYELYESRTHQQQQQQQQQHHHGARRDSQSGRSCGGGGGGGGDHHPSAAAAACLPPPSGGPPQPPTDGHLHHHHHHHHNHSLRSRALPLPVGVPLGPIAGGLTQTHSQPHHQALEGASHVHSAGPVATMNVSTIHGPSPAPLPTTYSIGTPQPVNFGLQPLSFPIGYNYLSSVPPSGVSCINPPLPVQMYIQPSTVSFPPGNQGGGMSQPLLPPSTLQPLQYYPPMSIPSTLAQQGSNVPGNPPTQPGVIPHHQSPSASQSPCVMPPLPPPSTQGYCSLPYSGPLHANGGFANSSGPPQGSLFQFGRPPVPQLPLVQGPPQIPTPVAPHHSQMRGPLVGGGNQGAAGPLVNGAASSPGGTNSPSMHYLLSAYRVGMLAMDTLARRVQDDRPQAKYARNPSYGEDVKWLLGVAKKLGTQHLHQFCLCSVNSVVSPFVLYDLAVEVASYLSRNNPALYQQPLRSPILQPLIQKCQQMFIQCANLKIYYVTQSDYEDFISVIRAARAAFQMTTGGLVQFNELLQSLKRSKCCKKELWQRLTAALQQPAPLPPHAV